MPNQPLPRSRKTNFSNTNLIPVDTTRVNFQVNVKDEVSAYVEGGTSLPASHHTTHESGGSDEIKLDDLATPDDNTDLDVTTSEHGLTPKAPGDTTKYLRGDGTWATPTGTTGGYVPSTLGLPPALGGWTQVNYGTSISDNLNGFIYLEAQDPGVNDTNNIRILTYPLPGSTFDLKTTIRPIWLDHRAHAYESSIGIRENGTGELVLFTFLVSTGTFYVQINRYNSPTSFSANLFSQSTALLWGNANFGFRIKQAAGVRTYWWSNDDGLHWMAIGQETSTDFLTPDQAVLAANSQVSGAVVGVLLNGWSLT